MIHKNPDKIGFTATNYKNEQHNQLNLIRISFGCPTLIAVHWVDIFLQIDAATLFANLSLSVLDMNVSTAEDKENVINATSIIVEGVGVILEYSSNVSHQLESPHSGD